MEWKVDIENKPNQRILVKFVPESETILFIGQFKPHNKEWVDFSKEECSMEINLLQIQDILLEVYETMKIRLNVYNNLSEGFSVFKKIEISEY
jgi:hypothetical protein